MVRLPSAVTVYENAMSINILLKTRGWINTYPSITHTFYFKKTEM